MALCDGVHFFSEGRSFPVNCTFSVSASFAPDYFGKVAIRRLCRVLVSFRLKFSALSIRRSGPISINMKDAFLAMNQLRFFTGNRFDFFVRLYWCGPISFEEPAFTENRWILDLVFLLDRRGELVVSEFLRLISVNLLLNSVYLVSSSFALSDTRAR
jgi:hypothetical protein